MTAYCLYHNTYDPGISPGSANQCILGEMYLRSNLLRELKSGKSGMPGGWQTLGQPKIWPSHMMAGPMPGMVLGQCASSAPAAQFISIVHDVKPHAADPEKMASLRRNFHSASCNQLPFRNCSHNSCRTAPHQH